MLSPAERSQFLPQLLLLLMIAIWGASFSATKVALDAGIPALALIAIRFWIAVICLLPILDRTRPYLGLGSSWLKGAATGLALLFGYWFQTHGMKETTSSVGGFMTGLIVLIVAVGARVFFNERMSRKYITGLLTGCVGLLVLCYGATANETGKNSLSGILLQVGSSSCFAAHVLLVSRFSPRGNEIAFCWWQLTAVAIGATIAATAAGFDLQDLIAATPNTWLAIGYLGLLYRLGNHCTEHDATSRPAKQSCDIASHSTRFCRHSWCNNNGGQPRSARMGRRNNHSSQRADSKSTLALRWRIQATNRHWPHP